MPRLVPALALIALAALPAVSAPQPDLRLVDPRCEYLRNPLGIDSMRPRLSWQLASASHRRGAAQSAYQVLVATNPAGLAEGKADLWDSGKVRSNQTTLVEYSGKAMRPRLACYWKARSWDEQGRATLWSPTAYWTMGPLTQADWGAQWIHAPGMGRTAPWLRKPFDLPARPLRAYATVASIGFHELYINGRKVGDAVLTPTISELGKRARYITYDITGYLQPGRNVAGLWLASGWGGYGEFRQPQHPAAIARLDLAMPGNATVSVVTDATWRARASNVTAIGGFPTSGGERVDAGKANDGWSSPDLDDGDWGKVVVIRPKVALTAEMIEPDRPVQVYKPVLVEPRRDGAYRVDMGASFSGFLDLALVGKPGAVAAIHVSERETQPESFGQRCELVLGPDGRGRYTSRFNYVAGRWITITGLTQAPVPADVRGYLVRPDYERVGRFECSDPLLNRIYDTTLHTYESLSQSGYTVDCPHRERMGYGGDAHATMETAMRNFGMGPFYTKWLGDWRDIQKPNGDLAYTAPTYNGGGGPSWSGICITLPWAIYRSYGDRRVLEQTYPTMQRWMAFFQGHARDNIVQKWGGVWDFLGDWVPPGRDQGGNRVDEPSTLFYNNCYFLYNTRLIGEIAAVLGHAAEAATYRARAEAIAAAIHARFYDPVRGTYANGTQLYPALALYTGVTPPGERPRVLANLVRQIEVEKSGHVDTGIHGTYFLLKTLIGLGRNDLAALMAGQTTYPGWGYMLAQGATTIWEQWDGEQSRLHSSFLSIGLWYIEGAGGIRPDPVAPGFQQFEARPGTVPQLSWVRCSYRSIHGPIICNWRRTGGTLVVDLEVPANTSATLYLPVRSPGVALEGGKPAARAAGLRYLGVRDGCAVYRVQSGRYHFTAR